MSTVTTGQLDRQMTWRKSSRSYGGGSECVEAAVASSQQVTGQVAVRDSMNPGGGNVTMAAHQWRALLTRIKEGAYDLT